MKKIINRFVDWFVDYLPIILAILLIVGGYALSWIVTCGLIKLITMCFGWTFSWGIATGIWLIIYIAKSVFGKK